MELRNSLRENYLLVRDRVTVARDAIHRELARLDPNDDPDAEPLTLLPLLVFAGALAFSVWMFLRWKFQPMQDLGHHIALSAVVADYGHSGSLYPALYERPDGLFANTLLYTIAGVSGRVIGVTLAFRLCIAFYLAGVPLANLYALRVFGRSPWSAIASIPLTMYNMNYVAGFANFLFAAPFVVLLVPTFYRLMSRGGKKWIATNAILFVLLFLAHAQLFLWTGFVCFAMTLAAIVFRARGVPGLRGKCIAGLKTAGIALASVVPAAILFLRWYSYAFGAHRNEGAVSNATGELSNNFGASFKPPVQLMIDLGNYALNVFMDDKDLRIILAMGGLVAVSVALARLTRWSRPPVLEAVFVLTFGSYFLLPEAIQGQEVIGSRQVGVSFWFIAVLMTPVAAHVSRIARFMVVGGIVVWTWAALQTYYERLVKFEHEAVPDLRCAIDNLPPRLRMHFVKLTPSTSQFFEWRSYWHVEKYYMGDAFGETPDNPAINSTSPIRFKAGVDYHRIAVHPHAWYRLAEIWNHFDLVLVDGWNPSADDLQEAKRHGVRIRKCGAWEVWRTHGPWETGEAPAWKE